MAAPTATTDEEAIRNVLATYCQTVDDGRFDEWERIWTEDASFTVLGRSHAGRSALRAFIESAQAPHLRGKHVTVNHLITVDGDRATATSDFLFLAPGDGDGLAVTQVGRYEDRLVRTAEGWRLAERRVTLGLPGRAQPPPG